MMGERQFAKRKNRQFFSIANRTLAANNVDENERGPRLVAAPAIVRVRPNPFCTCVQNEGLATLFCTLKLPFCTLKLPLCMLKLPFCTVKWLPSGVCGGACKTNYPLRTSR